MAKSAMQKIKILYLMKILLEETDDAHGMTLSELSDALQAYGIAAERKALYDDIETLRIFGLDIEMRKEKTVRYHVVSRDFELAELKLLVDAVQASKFISHRKSSKLIRKLSALTSRHEATQLQRQVYVSSRIKTKEESTYYAVDELHTAISNDAQITFQYFDWSPQKTKELRYGGKTYAVSPWALAWEDENYYLIAYDEVIGEIRHYRVDRMQRITVTKKRRNGGELFRDFDMGVYSKKTFGMYRGREELVTFRCLNRFAGAMIDRFGMDTTFLPVDGEHFEFCARVKISPTFLSWVMIFGDGLEIVSPGSVRTDFVDYARKALAQYGEL